MEDLWTLRSCLEGLIGVQLLIDLWVKHGPLCERSPTPLTEHSSASGGLHKEQGGRTMTLASLARSMESWWRARWQLYPDHLQICVGGFIYQGVLLIAVYQMILGLLIRNDGSKEQKVELYLGEIVLPYSFIEGVWVRGSQPCLST